MDQPTISIITLSAQIMLNYTREELATKTALTNQMRNNLYHFLRYLISKGLSDREIKERLQSMGKNIANTLMDEMIFQGETLEELISSIYKEIFESKVQINPSSDHLVCEDKKCSLCKYKREDLTTSPCLIITSLVAEICAYKGYTISESTVTKSVALGDISCVHTYTIAEEKE